MHFVKVVGSVEIESANEVLITFPYYSLHRKLQIISLHVPLELILAKKAGNF